MADGIQRKLSRKERVGRVISDAMDKTIVVLFETRKRNRDYGKTITQKKKLYAHDEKNEAKVGDLVRLMETRPLSKTKRWRMVGIVEKAIVREQVAEV